MTIKIQPCHLADAVEIASNNIPAFWQDANWRLMWRDNPLDFVVSQAGLRSAANLLKEPSITRHQKAVDDADGCKLVGYVRWKLPDLPGVDEMWPEAKGPIVTDDERKHAQELYESAVWETDTSLDYLDEPATKMREELMAKKKYIYLQYLAVHPEQQRRGIGTALVNSVLEVADHLGLDCFVQACKPGLVTYYRAGFELLDEVVIDDSAEGGPGKYSLYFMERRHRS